MSAKSKQKEVPFSEYSHYDAVDLLRNQAMALRDAGHPVEIVKYTEAGNWYINIRGYVLDDTGNLVKE